MPVASLQSYRTVALRVHSTAFAAQGLAMFMQQAVLNRLRLQCGFEQIDPSGQARADIMLDLNVTKTGRGGDGWISNGNLATIETLLVLTDGQAGEIIGTATIHGKSSGIVINGESPENEAIDAVAQSIGSLLARSGCSGPRIAKAAPPPPPPPNPNPPPPGPGSAAPPDESHRADAEKLNDQGKEKLYGADIPGALAAFQQANTLLPDPRYEFNVCLALGVQQQWDPALAACRQARGMNPDAALAAKIDHRVELLQNHQ